MATPARHALALTRVQEPEGHVQAGLSGQRSRHVDGVAVKLAAVKSEHELAGAGHARRGRNRHLRVASAGRSSRAR